ncbi:hypothetical protein [Oleiharenicola lentus]|uniref:hypothetical protein n=1 Tax=Oleiharenicola lentus TaxID=2508720 RepID=UPI003F67B36B
MPLDRQTLIDTVRAALEPLTFAHTLWLGGSVAFKRNDDWSDVDLHVVVDDDKIATAFEAVETALARVAPVDLIYYVPEPTWHGHSQRFYRFKDARPWLLLDFCVMRLGNPQKFTEREFHGDVHVFFDRKAIFANTPPVDAAALAAKFPARIASLRTRVDMLAILVPKEIWRQQPIDAFSMYHGLILVPLVELLRMKHDPLRSNWSMRYLHRILPSTDAARFTRLLYVSSPAEIETKTADARAWFDTLANELSIPR